MGRARTHARRSTNDKIAAFLPPCAPCGEAASAPRDANQRFYKNREVIETTPCYVRVFDPQFCGRAGRLFACSSILLKEAARARTLCRTHASTRRVEREDTMPDKAITVDAMGGDNAPGRRALPMRYRPIPTRPLSCAVRPRWSSLASQHERCVAQPTTEVIGMAEHPANAVRKKKDSSIVVGCRLVKEGAAQGFFSAGSTGLSGGRRDVGHGPHQRI